MDLGTATITDFNELVGIEFHVTDIENMSLHLDRVEALQCHDDSQREPFTLVFSGTHAEPLAQDTYELNHAKAGALTIFLVPFEETDGKVFYEAVFN